MKFLVITFEFPPKIGGIETRTKNYIQNMVKMKCDVRVVLLTSGNGKPISLENRFGATIYHCPSSPLLIFKSFISVIKSIRQHPIEVTHVLTGANTVIGLLFILYGKFKKIKTGIFLYGKDILTSQNDPIRLLLLHLALISSDKIGVNSKATAKLLPKQTLHKIHLLYPGVGIQTLTKFKVAQERHIKEKNILFVGRLIKRKGIDDLLRAFKIISEKMLQAKLTIVGDGPQRRNLHNLAKKLEIQNKVEFAGILTGEDLYRKYQECDVFVMPSKRIGKDIEGFGMVFLEAGFFRKPSIGTWSGGIPEAVVHNETGILVPEGDVLALKNAMETLLTNRKLAERLGRNAYKRVIDEFTWKKATLRLIKMYS